MQFAISLSVQAQDSARDDLPSQEEAALRAAAENIADSVVQIRTIGGLDVFEGTLLADGPTTGLVISADGYIISSAFNFVQQPASILVTLASGKQTPADLVATDHSRMIVLLKVSDVDDLPVPEIVPAEEIKPGQWAIAVGRTFRADRTNVSVGIVSAIGRMFGKVIQTDADVSNANYGGPLVDIRGRVLGLLVPMAPQGASEVAGTEWYDSGIGFAVPLASIGDAIERMKKGEDQRVGLLGIGMPAKNAHSSPAELAAVRPDSPAGKAGLKKGDRIVEVDGKPIRTQTDLRFALGPRYGGETVKVVAKRGEEQLERTITLAGELPAFRHAFLGILPMRPPAKTADNRNEADEKDANAKEAPESDADTEKEKSPADAGVTVRMVYTNSPAEKADVEPGDRITQIDDTKVADIDDAIETLNNVAPESEVKLKLVRNDKPIELTLTTTHLPSGTPNELPPARIPAEPDAAKSVDRPVAATAGTTVELKLPEFPHQCQVYVPASHDAGYAQGALIWLHRPGDFDAKDVIRAWQLECDRDGLILVVPAAAENKRWERTEIEYLGRLTERVTSQYKVDPRRVVVYGQEGGGAMAWLLGLSGRKVFRGIATSAAPLPRQIQVPPNEPSQRLAIFAAMPDSKEAAAPLNAGLQKLSKAGYPVTTVTTGKASGKLDDSQREELARWIDTLDRF